MKKAFEIDQDVIDNCVKGINKMLRYTGANGNDKTIRRAAEALRNELEKLKKIRPDGPFVKVRKLACEPLDVLGRHYTVRCYGCGRTYIRYSWTAAQVLADDHARMCWRRRLLEDLVHG